MEIATLLRVLRYSPVQAHELEAAKLIEKLEAENKRLRVQCKYNQKIVSFAVKTAQSSRINCATIEYTNAMKAELSALTPDSVGVPHD
jgi:hypothetical protein